MGYAYVRLRGCSNMTAPEDEGPQCVRGDFGSAAVEGQGAPAPAEGWHAAIAILDVEEPGNAGFDGGADFRALFVIAAQVPQGDESAAGVIGVGHATGQIGPGPAAGC